MSLTLFIGSVVTLLVGLGVALAGWRGRRVNDHPLCRWCRFDLEGVYPGATLCPECGAGLNRARAIRRGARRRVWGAVALGVVLALASGLVVGTIVFATLTRSNLNEYKPAALLLWEGRHLGDESSQAAATEFARRLKADRLSPRRTRQAVELALDLQGDLERAWSTTWGDIVEAAHRKGVVDEDRFARYLRNAFVVRFQARERIRPGDALAIAGGVHEIRGGTSIGPMCKLEITGVEIGGRPVDVKPPGHFDGTSNEVWVSNSTTAMATVVSSGPSLERLWVGAEAHGELKPGPHEARVSLKLTHEYLGAFSFSSSSQAIVEKTARSLPFTVLEDGDDWLVKLRSEALATTTSDMLALGCNVELRNDLGQVFPSSVVEVRFAGLDELNTGLAHEVVLKSDNQEWSVGWLTTDPVVSNGMNESLQSEWDPPEALETVDVILRPSEAFARRTLSLTELLDEEVVIAEVDIIENGKPRRERGRIARDLIRRFLRSGEE